MFISSKEKQDISEQLKLHMSMILSLQTDVTFLREKVKRLEFRIITEEEKTEQKKLQLREAYHERRKDPARLEKERQYQRDYRAAQKLKQKENHVST